MSRHAARERALETLFQLDVNHVSADEASAYTYQVHEEDSGKVEFDEGYFQKLLKGVIQYRDGLDEVIDRLSKDWELERMPGVDRNILRLALYELLFEDTVPTAVAIDEALELAKSYAAEPSRKFINGVLSGALKILPDLNERFGR